MHQRIRMNDLDSLGYSPNYMVLNNVINQAITEGRIHSGHSTTSSSRTSSRPSRR